MALIIENGTGVAGANSYVSLLEADAYFTLFNNEDWDATDTDKEIALMHGTRSVDLLYGPKYMGYRKFQSTGPLLFPRMPFYDNTFQLITHIPQQLKDAVCEIAVKYLLGEDVYPTANTDSRVKVNKTKIGDIEIEKQYAGYQGTTESYSSFNKIDALLWPILKTKQTSINLLR